MDIEKTRSQLEAVELCSVVLLTFSSDAGKFRIQHLATTVLREEKAAFSTAAAA